MTATKEGWHLLRNSLSALGTRLTRPTDPRPLALFRIAFGLLMLFATGRFVARGWVVDLYIAPGLHFPYYGFGWVAPLPDAWMVLPFVGMMLTATGIALGLFTRVATLGFFATFSYVELIDKTPYLNHYYFVSLLTLLLAFMPTHRALSLDLRLGRVHPGPVPAWCLEVLRIQLALVYLFAGIAKLDPDWWQRALPLRIWLPNHGEVPLLGPLFREIWVAFAMSWAGLAFDLTIPFWLWWRRTRPLAYMVVVTFHLLTALLFPIGMFPWIMMIVALVFFSEQEVVALAERFGLRMPPVAFPARALPSWGGALLVALFGFQILMPLRAYAYPGDLLWHEAGYRFGWRVMLMEKTGTLFFRIEDEAGRRWELLPEEHLTPFQADQVSTQPDMILQHAHQLARLYAPASEGRVSVFADAFVSLNGRPSRRLVDPERDLAATPIDLRRRDWVLASPRGDGNQARSQGLMSRVFSSGNRPVPPQ
ncbi:MAG: HTTM domain-containing protein [Truepera sp.]|nr:HTTM domain-containing protein [Truepera sp.]